MSEVSLYPSVYAVWLLRGSKLSCLPFCWKCSLWLLDFGAHGIPCYRSAYEGWLLRGSKLWYLPFSWNNLCGVPANTTLNPCSQKLLFLLPSIRKLSWALAGNFLAWQFQGQISKFWPAARNDYFSIWDSFANPSFLGLATFGQDFKVWTSSLKWLPLSVLTPPWIQKFAPTLLLKTAFPRTFHARIQGEGQESSSWGSASHLHWTPLN